MTDFTAAHVKMMMIVSRVRPRQAWFGQLAEGVRLLAVGEADMAHACVYSRSGSATAVRQVFDASVAALPELKRKRPAFVF